MEEINESVTRKYGYIRDEHDHRDHLYLAPPSAKVLPKKVDLRPWQSMVYNQLNIGSCTAHSIASLIDYVRIKNKLKPYYPSRLFIYYNERVIEGTVETDAGAMLRDGIKSVATQGVCPESQWPYDTTKFTVKPPDSCYANALKEEAIAYKRLTSLNDYQSCLASGSCFVFGFQVFDSFESEEVAKTGIVPMPGPTDTLLGGHAVCAVGFDSDKQWFIVKNSWGPSWGDKGYFYLPYNYISNPNLATDFWTITKVNP